MSDDVIGGDLPAAPAAPQLSCSPYRHLFATASKLVAREPGRA